MTFGSYRDIFGGWGICFYRVVKIALYLSGRTFSRKESFLSETFRYKKTLGAFGLLEYWEEKCLFFWRNLFFNTYFELWEKLFRTFGEFFLCRSVTLALCLPRRTSSVKKISSWNCFNNCVEWSVLGKKTFCKGTHNLTIFVRSWANQYGRLAKKLGAGLLKVHSTGPVNLFPWKYFFEERSFLHFFSDFAWSTCGHSAKTF